MTNGSRYFSLYLTHEFIEKTNQKKNLKTVEIQIMIIRLEQDQHGRALILAKGDTQGQHWGL